jgi:hypothetical protein
MNNNCLGEEKIWEYLDDELDAEEAVQVHAHLEECPECAAQYREIRSFNSRLVIGFKNDFFSCPDKYVGKCVTCSNHLQDWGLIWIKLLFSNIAAFFSAFLVVIVFLPNIEGIPYHLELNCLRKLLLPLFQSITVIVGLVIIFSLSAVVGLKYARN